MNILVLCTDYPDDAGGVALAYIRTRNIFYKENGIAVDVLNFKANHDYRIDDISVFTLQSYNRTRKRYDVLVSHAPNIRNHFFFLLQNQHRFNKIIFFFHGHEVLKVDEVYSKPYPYVRKGWLKKSFQAGYDRFKLGIWRVYFPKLSYKSEFVFVSNWMFDEFIKWTKIASKNLRVHVIYNSVGHIFEEEQYHKRYEKKYDFITIRPNLDASKYAIDIVNSIALHNPNHTFLVVGRGNYFSHYMKAPNITWMQNYLTHHQMIDLLNQSKCALMPTRTDAQGVSACEMATFGIPLITSDIPVCHEVFSGFDNIAFIDNDNAAEIDIDTIVTTMTVVPEGKNMKYFSKSTINEEIKLITPPPPPLWVIKQNKTPSYRLCA